jgi:hypothetical protein
MFLNERQLSFFVKEKEHLKHLNYFLRRRLFSNFSGPGGGLGLSEGSFRQWQILTQS